MLSTGEPHFLKLPPQKRNTAVAVRYVLFQLGF
jgi:hypothetical protein